jgi:hypothetical protein
MTVFFRGLFSSSPNASVRQTHAAVARRDVLIKVVIKFVSDMLQETQQMAENAAASATAAVASADFDKVKAPETPESIPPGRSAVITVGIGLIMPL